MKKETIFKLIGIAIGVIFSLVMAEGIVRVYLFKSSAFSYSRMSSLVHLNQAGFTQAAKNEDILYEIKPNQNGLFRTASFQTNSFGFRDKDYSLEKPKKTIRGAFVGDSYTMGSGVELEEVFHSQMEAQLNSNSEGISYELINFGVSGYNLLNYWGVLNEKVLKFEPDFIVIGFCAMNDMKVPHKKHLSGLFKPKPKEENIYLKCYLREIWDTIQDVENASTPSTIESAEKVWIDKMFAHYSTFSRDHQTPIIINYLSILESDDKLKIIEEITAKNDLLFTTASSLFNNQAINTHRINILDSHPNAVANDVFTRSLLAYKPLLDIIAERKKVILNSTLD